LEIALAVLAGLLIGSFLNVCIFRLPRDLSVASPARSFCPGCEAMIAWHDNIPLLSFVLLGGKCRNCKESIPWRYPVVELATAIAFGVSIAMFGPTLKGLKFCVFSAIMIDLIVTDFEARILPDEFTLGGTVLGLVLAYFVQLEIDVSSLLFFLLGMEGPSDQWFSVMESALGAFFSCGLLWIVGWTFEKIRHKEGMGLGDVKMMALIGAFLGLRPALFAFFLAAVVGSFTGPFYAVIAKRKLVARMAKTVGMKRAVGGVIFRYQLPFGSYLGAMTLVVAGWMR